MWYVWMVVSAAAVAVTAVAAFICGRTWQAARDLHDPIMLVRPRNAYCGKGRILRKQNFRVYRGGRRS